MSDSEMWMVESGAYSDYQVHFVTADRKLAEDFCLKKNGGIEDVDYDGYRVETIPVYDTPPDWWTTIHITTSITPGHPPRRQGKPYLSTEFGRKSREPAAETVTWGSATGLVRVTTHGWDSERVEKSHSERVALEYAKMQGVA